MTGVPNCSVDELQMSYQLMAPGPSAVPAASSLFDGEAAERSRRGLLLFSRGSETDPARGQRARSLPDTIHPSCLGDAGCHLSPLGDRGTLGGAACVPQGWTGFCSGLSACPLLTFTLLPPSCSVLQECQPLGSFVHRPLRVFLHLFALFPYPPPSPATNSFLSGLAEALCTQYPLNYISYWHSPFPTVPTRISKCRPDEKWEQATEEGR